MEKNKKKSNKISILIAELKNKPPPSSSSSLRTSVGEENTMNNNQSIENKHADLSILSVNRTNKPNRNNPSPVKFQIKQEICDDESNQSEDICISSTSVACQTEEETLTKRTHEIEIKRLLKEIEAHVMKTKLLECENNKLRKEKEAALLLANEKKKELAKLNEELKDFKELQEKVVSFQSSISKFTTEPVKRNENSKRFLSPSSTCSARLPVKKSKLKETLQNGQTSINEHTNEIDLSTDISMFNSSLLDNTRRNSNTTEIRAERKYFYSSLDKEVWKQMKNNSKNENRINIKELKEQEQQIECNRLVDFCVNIAMTEFDRTTNLNYMAKTTNGYTVGLQCTQCSYVDKSHWIFRINATNSVVNVNCNQPCNHLFSTAPAIFKDKEKKEKISIEMKLQKEFNNEVWQSLPVKRLPPLSQLAKPQADELDSLNNEFKEHLENIGLKTQHNCIIKTETGYTFTRTCSFKDCTASLLFKVNMANNVGRIVFNSDCKQLHNLT